jgi:hypothetical protein
MCNEPTFAKLYVQSFFRNLYVQSDRHRATRPPLGWNGRGFGPKFEQSVEEIKSLFRIITQVKMEQRDG